MTSDIPALAYDGEVSRYVESFAVVLTEAGIPRMPSRVFACLMASEDGHLTAGELAERLQISLAAVSGAVRYLVNIELIRRGRTPGARRDYYMVLPNIWYESFADRGAVLERWQVSAAEGADIMGRETEAGRRLAETEEFFGFLRTELPLMMGRWREHRTRWIAEGRAVTGSRPAPE